MVTNKDTHLLVFAAVLEADLDWAEIQWGPSAVTIKGTKYPLRTLVFKPITTPGM